MFTDFKHSFTSKLNDKFVNEVTLRWIETYIPNPPITNANIHHML